MKNTFKVNETVILNRDNRKFLAVVSMEFADQYGLIMHYNPYVFSSSVEKDGKLYSITTAFNHELSKSKVAL
jgi:hypothetical protein